MKADLHSLLPVLIGLLEACSPKYYVPNTQNVPAITHKTQTNLSVAGNQNQVEVQGAFGFSDKAAFQINSALYIPRNEPNSSGDGSGALFEGGVGYYQNITPDLLFDIYGLCGYGQMRNHFPSSAADYPGTEGKISARILRYGAQPGITLHNQFLSASLSSRVVGLTYTNIKGDLIFSSENQQQYLRDNQTTLLIEPSLTLRVGVEKVKVQLQIVRSINLLNEGFRQDKVLISFGLNVNLPHPEH